MKVTDVYDLEAILKEMHGSDSWFSTFLSKRTMDAGILRLKPGEKDPQGPHANDELYFVINGHGLIRIGETDHQVKPGSVVFVPARKQHHFHGNKDELQVLYVFAGADKDV